MVLRHYILASALLLCNCATTNLASSLWDDEIEAHRYRGGWFSYPSTGLANLGAGWQQETSRQARMWCGEREVVWLSAKDVEVNYGSANSAIGYDSQTDSMSQSDKALYLRSPFGNNFSQVQQRRSLVFQCAEKNPLQELYGLVWESGTSQPVCQEIHSALAPSLERLGVIRTLPESIDCLQQQGWLLVATPQGKILWFLQELGYRTCQHMLDALANLPYAKALQTTPILPHLQCPWLAGQSDE